MTFDMNGNPDVMGSVLLSAQQIDAVNALKLDFNALHQKCMLPPSDNASPEALRLYAIARTHLEIACMAAVKAISRS